MFGQEEAAQPSAATAVRVQKPESPAARQGFR